ncbi:two-component system sensor histidine kinase [Pedobacter sp. BAL39]|nr:two-component system sensor histidine kinase [Pedobacter sp. BAL39]
MVTGKQLSIWKKLIGEVDKFTLEERIFNTVCVFTFIAFLLQAPYNFAIGLAELGWLCLVSSAVILVLYYYSKIRRKPQPAITWFCIGNNVAFIYNYFYNSGINGPNALLFALSIFVMITIIPKKQYIIWVPLNIVVVLSLIFIELKYPHLVPMLYVDVPTRAIDFAMTYFVTIVLIFLSISYLRKNYEHERLSVEKRNEAIREQNEQILLQKSELEASNSEKDRLFSIVAHDVRMPLSSIQGYLEILNGIGLEEEEKQLIEGQLLQITRDTSEMLMNLLSWSKAQLNGMSIKLKPMDVNATLRDWLKVEKSIAAKKGIRLAILTAGQLNIMADHDMLHLVVRNLVSNALKFTPEGGEVVISTRYRESNGVIVISDNGIGIAKDKQETLFNLKASATYGTNNEKGIGLGLLLCKEFTEQQGGSIWYESRSGTGSVFQVAFRLEGV